MEPYYETPATQRQGINVGCSDRPYFARVGDLADEAQRIGDYIEQFIDRCRGGGGTSEKASGPVPVPTGHFATIDRLGENLSRVDKLARELQTIG